MPDAELVSDVLGEPACDGRAAAGSVDRVALLDCDTLKACEPLGNCETSTSMLLLLLLLVLLLDGVPLHVRLAESLRDAWRELLRDTLRVCVPLRDDEPAALAVELCEHDKDVDADAEALCDAVCDRDADAEVLWEREGLPDPLGVSDWERERDLEAVCVIDAVCVRVRAPEADGEREGDGDPAWLRVAALELLWDGVPVGEGEGLPLCELDLDSPCDSVGVAVSLAVLVVLGGALEGCDGVGVIEGLEACDGLDDWDWLRVTLWLSDVVPVGVADAVGTWDPACEDVDVGIRPTVTLWVGAPEVVLVVVALPEAACVGDSVTDPVGAKLDEPDREGLDDAGAGEVDAEGVHVSVPLAVSVLDADASGVPVALAVIAWLREASGGDDGVGERLAVGQGLSDAVPDAEPLPALLCVAVSEADMLPELLRVLPEDGDVL